MIKVVASLDYEIDKKKTCSFQTKENRPITFEDLNRVWKFINEALLNGYRPQVSWKITYDQRVTHSIVAGMSSKFVIISQDRGLRLINHMIDSINNNLGTR